MNSEPVALQHLPPRGIFVLDTCDLLRLSLPLPLRASGSAPIRLIDGFVFLSKLGYRIVIPEMVANECGGFMRDATTLQDYFPGRAYWDKSTAKFLRSIPQLQKEGCDIEIAPPPAEDVSKGAEHLRNLYAIHTQPTFGFMKKKRELLAATKQYESEKNRGDKAAEALIRSWGNSQVPVCYVTSDKGAWKAVELLAGQMPLSHANYLGFYSAFAPFFSHADMRSVSLEKLESYLVKQAIAHKSASSGPSHLLHDACPGDDEVQPTFPLRQAMIEAEVVLRDTPKMSRLQADMQMQQAQEAERIRIKSETRKDKKAAIKADVRSFQDTLQNFWRTRIDAAQNLPKKAPKTRAVFVADENTLLLDEEKQRGARHYAVTERMVADADAIRAEHPDEAHDVYLQSYERYQMQAAHGSICAVEPKGKLRSESPHVTHALAQ